MAVAGFVTLVDDEYVSWRIPMQKLVPQSWSPEEEIKIE
jgi:hypothetical protein